MSDPDMITAYSWAATLLFQNELPSSLSDVYKRAMLVNEINAPLIQGKGVPSAVATLSLVDLDNNEKSQRGEFR
jgi:hypothetical protein